MSAVTFCCADCRTALESRDRDTDCGRVTEWVCPSCDVVRGLFLDQGRLDLGIVLGQVGKLT